MTCSEILESNSSLDALVPLLSKPNNHTIPGKSCRDNGYDRAVKQLQNSTWDEHKMARQWTYQTCNEFGFFQTAGSSESPFYPLAHVLNVTYYLSLCRDSFSAQRTVQMQSTTTPMLTCDPTAQPPETCPDGQACPKCGKPVCTCPAQSHQLPSVPTGFTNGYYGAKKLGASRVVLPDGSIDPWHSLALTQVSESQRALGLTPVIIDGTTHCGDMHYPRPDDSPSLQAAHAKIAAEVGSWLPPRPGLREL